MTFQDPGAGPALSGGRRVSSTPALTGGRRVSTQRRSFGERFSDNLSDAWQRSGAGQLSRNIDPNANGFDLGDIWQAPRLKEGGLADRALDLIAPNRSFLQGEADITSPADRQERERRARYDARAAADPISGVGDSAAYLGGQVVGSALSPDSWVGAGRTVLGRVASNAGIGAGLDVLLQGGDIGRGVQDDYSLSQTLMAGASGGVIQGGIELGGSAGRALLSGGRRVLSGRPAPSPVPSFDGPAMDAGPVGTRALDPSPSPRATPSPSRAPRAPREIAPVIGAAAQEFAIPESYLLSLASRESAFNPNARARTSSATGLYQFIDDTWLKTIERHGPALGLGNMADRVRTDPGGVLALRTDPALNARAAALLTRDNAAHLGRALGREATPGELYAAHFLGPAGAVRLARADPNASAAQLFPEAAAANRNVFYRGGRPRTVGEVRASFEADFGGRGVGGVAREADAIAPQRDALVERYPDAPPEAIEIARLAVSEPARAREVMDVLAQEGLPRRSARNMARAMVRQAQLEAGGVAARVPAEGASPTAGRPALSGGKRVAPDMLAIARAADRGPGMDLASGGQAGGLRDAPRPSAVARDGAPVYAGKTVSELADDLRAVLGLTHRQGRVGAKRALGTYNTGSGVVRTKAVDELDVLAHEATHALEYEPKGPALGQALAAHEGELSRLAYPGAAPGVMRQEGFAEFGRWYLTNPDHARRVAPRFYAAFEAAMQADSPQAFAGMKAIQEGYQNLLSSASVDVAQQSIAYTGSKGPIGDLVDEFRRRGPEATVRRLLDDIYTALLDDLHPVSVAVRKLAAIYTENTGNRLSLKRAQDPYALARLSREAYAAGHNDLMNGVTPYHGLDPEGPSLADALETAGLDRTRTGKFKPEATREFDAYLIARRMVHEWDRYGAGELPNPPDRNTREFHEQVIADSEAAHPTWAEAAQQVYGFLDNLWRKEFEAGLITEASYKNGLESHPDYVPLMRDMSDKGPGRAGKPRGALQFAGGVKAFEGSSRDIISPLSSIMRRTYELNAIVKRNDVMLALDNLAQKAGRGAGAIIERLPADEIEMFTVNASDALSKTADELGLVGRDLTTMQKFADDAASQDLTIQLFRQTEFSPRKGEAVVFVWRDGQKTPLLLPDGDFGKQMFDALTGMNRDLRNAAVDIMAAGTQALRYGVTLSPEFMGANLVRDALATWINTDVGFIPGFDTIRGGAAELAQGQTAQRYATAGGMRGGANTAATAKPFPRTDAEAEAQLQHLRRKGWKVKRFASWRGLAEATDLSETSTRVGVFKRAFDQAKRQGLSDYEALIESGFVSRDYLDFGRRGSKMITASRLVTFLNAALQGLDKSARVLTAGGNLKAVLAPLSKAPRTEAERRAVAHAFKAWAKVSALGALGLGLRALYADDPEYQEIGDRLRATHWIFKAGGEWVFVPKPFELATLSNILERGFEGTVLGDPTAGERLLSDMSHTIAPPSEIPALSVPFHLAANRDYLGRPIVPDHLKGTVDPERQFTAYTSDLGKLIGRTFGLSPAQVDYVVTGFGGSLGRYGLQGSNLIGEAITGRPRTASGPEDWFLSRRFVREPARGSTSQAEFWNNVSRDGGDMTRAEGTFRSLMRDGGDQEAITYLNSLPPDQRAYVVAKVFSVDGSSRDHPMVRAQAAVSVYGDFRTALRDGELRGADGQPIPLDPRQRREIDSALSDLSMAEMRNALIEAGVTGWAQKEPMDSYAIASRIGATSPDVARELWTWLGQARVATVFHPDQMGASQQRWSAIAPLLSEPIDPGVLSVAMQRERMTSGDRLDRYREGQRAYGQRALSGGRRVE